MFYREIIEWHEEKKIRGKYVFSFYKIMSFCPYKILMLISFLKNIIVCKISPYFESFFLQKMNTFSRPK